MIPGDTVEAEAPETYKDLHGGMKDSIPKITMGRLNNYMAQFAKGFDDKCQDMYRQRYSMHVHVWTFPPKLSFSLYSKCNVGPLITLPPPPC